MLTLLCGLGGLVLSYFGLTFVRHVYLIKTNPGYRQELALGNYERHLQRKMQRLDDRHTEVVRRLGGALSGNSLPPRPGQRREQISSRQLLSE